MINAKNTVKTGYFYKGLFLGLLLLVTSNLYQVSAQSTCNAANMILVGAADFECTYDYGDGQTNHELQHARFIGPSGAFMSTTYTWAGPTGANIGVAGNYAVVKNPADVGKGYPSINDPMIIFRWAGSDATMMQFNAFGLNPGAPIQIKIYGYYLSAYSCTGATPSFRVVYNLSYGSPSGGGSTQSFTGTPGLGNAFVATYTGTLPAGHEQADIFIRGDYYPNSCGVIGISKIEVYSCPNIEIKSLESDEMCIGEQTRLTLDRDYATNLIKWEKSTTSATAGFTEIPGTFGSANILQEVTQDTWYRCTVSNVIDGTTRNVVSKALKITTIKCCENSEGLATSRKVVYHETFGVFTGPRSYVDMHGVSQPGLVMGDYCARLPAAPGAPTGVQGHTNVCLVTNMGHYSITPYEGLNVNYMIGCIKGDASNTPRGGIMSIDVADGMTGVIYERLIDGLCSGKEIYFQIAYAPGASGSTNAQIEAAITKTDGTTMNNRTVLVQKRQNGGFACGWNIIKTAPFVLPAGETSVYLQLRSFGTNWKSTEDLNFDDIKFMVCSPPNIELYSNLDNLKLDTTVCGPTSLDIATKVSNLVMQTYGGEANVRYLFQWSSDNKNWNNIGAGTAAIRTTSSITINSDDYNFPRVYFRLAVATEGALQAYVTNPNYESFEDNCRNTSVSKSFALIKENSLNSMEEVPLQACKGDKLTLNGVTAAQEPKITQWAWEDGAGNILVPKGNVAANRNYTYTFSGTGSSATVYFVGYTSSCIARKKFTITEKPTVTISLTPTQECGKTTITASGTPASGVTYAWSYTNGSPITTTGSSVTLNSPAYNNGTISVTGTATGYCASAQASASVTIKTIPARPTATTPLSYQMLPGNVDITTDANVQYTAGNTLYWRYAGTNPSAPGSIIAPPPTQSTATEGTFYFWVGQISTDGCRSDSFQIAVIITDVPAPVVRDTSLCQGQPVNLSILAKNTDPLSYDLLWYTDPNAAKGTGSTTPPTVNTSSFGVQTFYVSQKEKGSSKESGKMPIKVTVIQTPTVNNPGNQTKCNGTATDAVNFTGNTPSGVTYTWTNTNAAIGIPASGTDNIASRTATNTTTAPIVGTITVTPTFSSCPGTAVSFTITVNPTPTVTNPGNQTKCAGETTDAVNFSGNISSGVTYTWTNTNAAIGLAASGTGDIAAFLAANATTVPISGTIEVTPIINGCQGTPQSFTITVNPVPTVNTPAGQTKCAGEATDVVNFSGNIPSGVTYNWTNTNTAIGLAATGTGNIATFPAANATTAPISGTITVTPTISGCPGTSTSFTITVNPVPTVTKPVDQTKCKDETTDAVNFAGNITSGVTYNWTNTNTNIGLAASGNGDIASFTANNSTTAQIISTVEVTPTLNGCTGTPQSFTITVNPVPTVDNPGNQTKCNGAPTDAVIFTGNIAVGVDYDWTNDNPAIGLPAVGTGNIASFTATNSTTAAISATITVTPKAGCTGTSTSFTITVNPTPTVDKPTNQTKCNGAPTDAVSFTGNMAGVTYNWTNSNTAIGLAANGSGDIASFIATNTTNAPISGTVTVTPTINSCTGTSTSFDFTVDPTPTVTKPANQTKCNGASTDPVNFIGNITSGVTYNWTNSNPAIGLAAGGTGNIASFTATSTTVSITATITVTPETTTCVGLPVTFTITAIQTPTVTGKTDGSRCGAGEVTLGAAASAGEIKWYTVSTGGTAVETGTSFKPSISSTTSYWVEAIDNNCTSLLPRTQVTATINQYPTITVNPADPICEGETTVLYVNPTPSNATIQWSDPTVITSNAAGTEATVRPPYKNGVNHRSVYTYNVTVTDAGGLCPKPYPVTVTVDEPLTGKIVTTNPQTCEGGSVTVNAGSYAAETYSWTSPEGAKSGAQITVSPKETTTYILNMVRGVCKADDNITIEVNSKPVILLIDSVGVRDREIVHKPGTGTQPFLFGVDGLPADNDPVKRNLAFGSHSFYIIDAAGCRSADTDMLVEPMKLFPPSSFTPNGDGYNDTWEIPGMREVYPDATISIYDRYGKKLTEYKGSADQGWDGRYLGREMPTTDYWYEINIKEINMQYVGHFTLLRR